MAVTSGTISSVDTVLSDNRENTLQIARVLFTISGTYNQTDNSQITAVATAIQDSRRNGKTVTLKDAMLCQAALDSTNSGLLLGAKTIAVSGADITFELTEGATANTLDLSTELSAGTIPTQATPLGFFVSFIES